MTKEEEEDTTPTSTATMWGEWMGAWKTSLDEETERIDRQKAAFGAESVARIKDLNVLVVGIQGVGVETAKNLILSNVGSVTLFDPAPCVEADRGTNFYVQPSHVEAGCRRDEACLAELKSLNPFCKVRVLTETKDDDDDDGEEVPCASLVEDNSLVLDPDVAGTGKGYAAVVVTSLPAALAPTQSPHKLYGLNERCRDHGIAFVVACNHGGITASIFSDFGPSHEITDAFGEPTKLLALSGVEVLEPSAIPEGILQIDGHDPTKPVVVLTVAQSDHGLDTGDKVQLEDLRDSPLEAWNGRTFTVRRVAFKSPTAAGVDARDVAFLEILKQPTAAVLSNFDKQLRFYRQQHEEDPNTSGKKLPMRTITMFNRLALVLDETNDDNDSSSELPGGLSWDEVAGGYRSGGLLQQVKPTIRKEYSSLRETLEEATPVPQMLRGDDWEAGKGIDVHLAWSAVLAFYEQRKAWPGLQSQEDAEEVVKLAEKISLERRNAPDSASRCWAQKVSYGFPTGEPRPVDTKRLRAFASLFRTELTGLCAFLGGAAAQEVLKATGKFTPLNQWIHHDETCLLSGQTVYEDPAEDSFGVVDATDRCDHGPLLGSRYDHQIAVMGKAFQAKIASSRVFLVGCGALGCEYLKGLALMGAGVAGDGRVWVTDMDRIETSNLSRQFLFRDHDVGSPKSVSGARVVKGWNPSLNITALEKRVGGDTEDFFDEAFWESLDVCWNALDNVQARKYTDAKCLLHSKPLLESGTLGTKCNHEVILPFRTSTYNDGTESDENEAQIAMCTLRSFPYLPLHCIEFAKQAYFSDRFEFGPDQYETFRKDPAGFMEQLEAMDAGEQLKALTMIRSYLDLQQQQEQEQEGITFGACVGVAFREMMTDFSTSVKDLCHSADAMEASSGTRFWTGTKRRPKPVEWPANGDPAGAAPELLEYLYCTANLHAVVWGLEPVRDRAAFQEIVASLRLETPEWKPPSKGVDLTDGADESKEEDGEDAAAATETLKGGLYGVDPSSLLPAVPHDFEKDDDTNFHVDYLTIATNLRAWNYDIKASERHQVKVTAGRIIPALATTTAMVCGLVDVEFCKLVLGLEHSMGKAPFLNSNINLAAGSGNFTTFAPDPPIALETGLSVGPKTFTSWDHITLHNESEGSGEKTVEGLVEYLEQTFGVVVDRVFDPSGPADKAIYSAVDRKKLTWDISGGTDGEPLVVSDGVYTQWPQIRMAVQMLGRLPPTSGQRRVFEGQIDRVRTALGATKASFEATWKGPVSAAHTAAYRPPEGDDDNEETSAKRAYFDAVRAKRSYRLLDVHCRTRDTGEDVRLPSIKYLVARTGDQE